MPRFSALFALLLLSPLYARTQPPAGFTPLFDGESLEGWKGLVGTPLSRRSMTPEQLRTAQATADARMRASWQARDGKLCFSGHGDNICTVKHYGDFEMYIDWRLEKHPEADAGIYLRGNPQVQIWNIARTDVGAQVGSGGLYNNQKHRSAPSKVMDKPLGEWNTFFIRMQGERVTVHLNGERVVDNVPLENYWDRSRPLPEREQIELQAHGCKVEYKNIFIRELPDLFSPEELTFMAFWEKKAQQAQTRLDSGVADVIEVIESQRRYQLVCLQMVRLKRSDESFQDRAEELLGLEAFYRKQLLEGWKKELSVYKLRWKNAMMSEHAYVREQLKYQSFSIRELARRPEEIQGHLDQYKELHELYVSLLREAYEGGVVSFVELEEAQKKGLFEF